MERITGNYIANRSMLYDRLAAIEDILGDEYELDDLKAALKAREKNE